MYQINISHKYTKDSYVNKTLCFQCVTYVIYVRTIHMPFLLIIFLITLVLSLIFLAVQLIIGNFIEARAATRSPFECGLSPVRTTRVAFSLRFFILAILFVIFDVELVLLMPRLWGIAFSFSYFFPVLLLFVIIIGLGLIYEWFDGSLSWIDICNGSLI